MYLEVFINTFCPPLIFFQRRLNRHTHWKFNVYGDFTHTFCPIAPTKNSNKKGHFPHEIHAKNVLFTYSHQPDSLEMYFSNQPDNLYYPKDLHHRFSKQDQS